MAEPKTKVEKAGPGTEDKLALEQLRLYENRRTKYDSNFRDDHQAISNYFLPQDSNIQTQKTESVSGWTQEIYDTTPIQAAQTYAAGDYNWLTPPQQPWSEYAPPKELREKVDDDAVTWLAEASDDVMDAFSRSNFPSVRALNALGVGVFGTDFVLFEEDEKQPGEFNFRHAQIGTYVIAEDYTGVVDTTQRKFKMTYRQIKQEFNKPIDNIPEKMKAAAKGPNGMDKEFEILHCIFPREDSTRLPGRKDGANKPIASVYVSMEYKECIRIGGYEEQPCLVPRFAKWGTNSVWGFGPAYLALPDARELNYMAMYMDAAAEKLIDPRILVPDNLEGDVDLRAGGITTFDSGNPNAKPAEWASAAEYKLGMEIMEQKRNAIRDAFFNSSFKLLNSDPLIDKISQRLAENLQGVTPMLGRRIPEFINPLMRRAFGIRYRAGKFGPAPDSLMQDTGKVDGSGKPIKALILPDVMITSRINDALKALKNRGTEETFQFIASIPGVETKPELFDPFDMDKTITDYARNTGMPPDNFRPEKGSNSIAAIRQNRANLQQQQRAAALAEQMGKAGAGLGKSPQFVQDAAKDSMPAGRNGRS